MDIKYRKLIYKFPQLYILCQRIVEWRSKLFYNKLNLKSDNLSRIKSLHNTHINETCFIVGNGPSLKITDLEQIKQYDCFAANLIYKIFNDTTWRPKYYFCVDRYANTHDDLDTLDIPYMFISDYYWRCRDIKNKNAICLHTYRAYDDNVKFCENVLDGVMSHYTVSFVMIQMAVYIGYKNIYLIGMDHNYALMYDKSGNVIRDDNIVSHVFKDDNPDEVVANIEGMNKSYICAREYAEKNNINIVNVTDGGKLEWFKRDKLENVLMRSN